MPAFRLPAHLAPQPRGFAVDVMRGRIHRRYAEHAVGLPRTSAVGVESLLGRIRPKLCTECFPPKVAAPR